MAGERQGRLADRIRVILAERLDKGLRDPRLGFVTITEVRVSGDLQHASVFYTVLGTDEERASSAAALTAATGMLRKEVGKHLGVRLVPTRCPKRPTTFRHCCAKRASVTPKSQVLPPTRSTRVTKTRT